MSIPIHLSLHNDGFIHPREFVYQLLYRYILRLFSISPRESADGNLRQTLNRLWKTLPEISTKDGSQRASLLLSDAKSSQGY